MALKLSLKPGERVAVNGAVLVNGDRRATLLVESRASILREKDIMRPEDATTPARLIYLSIMMMALDASTRAAETCAFERRITEFARVVSDPAALALCLKISARVANGDHYRALAFCRELMAFEEKRLAHVA